MFGAGCIMTHRHHLKRGIKDPINLNSERYNNTPRLLNSGVDTKGMAATRLTPMRIPQLLSVSLL